MLVEKNRLLTFSARFLTEVVVSVGLAGRSVSLAMRLKRCIRSRTLSCSAEEFVVVAVSSSCNLTGSNVEINPLVSTDYCGRSPRNAILRTIIVAQ